jgi:hypothetical protein
MLMERAQIFKKTVRS